MSDRVALFVTCLADIAQPEVAVATVRVLRSVGCDVTVPEGQTCCGQPAWNSGFAREASRVAATSLDALEEDPDSTVVVPAGSCATMIRIYWPALFREVGDGARARRAEALGTRLKELTEFLAVRDLPAIPPAAEDREVVYHRSCHMERELHLHDEPTAVLGRAGGCTVIDWSDDDRCCGFGGTFSVKLPETSVAMADQKLDSLPAGVNTVVGADSSCLLHLQARADHRGLPVRTRHIAEVLADTLESRA
jgi:L-lactate dehydrogenase complex protein LldE